MQRARGRTRQGGHAVAVIVRRRRRSWCNGDADCHIHSGVVVTSGIVAVSWLYGLLVLPCPPARSSALSPSYPHFPDSDRCRFESEDVLREYKEDLDKVIALQLQLQ